jgi:hypothetical protein
MCLQSLLSIENNFLILHAANGKSYNNAADNQCHPNGVTTLMPTCAKYDIDNIDVVEKALISSKGYNKIQQYPNMMALNKPSLSNKH